MLTTFYFARNDHRWVTFISLKTIPPLFSLRPEEDPGVETRGEQDVTIVSLSLGATREFWLTLRKRLGEVRLCSLSGQMGAGRWWLGEN